MPQLGPIDFAQQQHALLGTSTSFRFGVVVLRTVPARWHLIFSERQILAGQYVAREISIDDCQRHISQILQSACGCFATHFSGGLGMQLVDFLAALFFLVGSVLFFYASLENPAIWCFVVGSACFMMKPTIRVVREFHYLVIGDYADLAERLHR